MCGLCGLCVKWVCMTSSSQTKAAFARPFWNAATRYGTLEATTTFHEQFNKRDYHYSYGRCGEFVRQDGKRGMALGYCTKVRFVRFLSTALATELTGLDLTKPGQSAEQLMAHYMEHMYRELFLRACHPVLIGRAVFRSMDIVGIEGAERWDMSALMRYRSRRALLEVITAADTLGRHEYKVAALEKTIAFPIETELYLGDPRLLLGLGLLAAQGFASLVGRRR